MVDMVPTSRFSDAVLQAEAEEKVLEEIRQSRLSLEAVRERHKPPPRNTVLEQLLKVPAKPRSHTA